MDFSRITDATLIAAAISGIVTALTQAAKMVAPPKDQRYLPALPLVLGVLIALLVATDYSYGARVLGGLLCGLTSMGLYSGGKTVLGK